MRLSLFQPVFLLKGFDQLSCRFLFRLTHIRLFRFRVDRNQEERHVVAAIVIDNSYTTSLPLSFRSPSEFPKTVSILDDGTELSKGGKFCNQIDKFFLIKKVPCIPSEVAKINHLQHSCVGVDNDQ